MSKPIHTTDKARQAGDDQPTRTPPPPSTLPEERFAPGLDGDGTGGAGAAKPEEGPRTRDRDVGNRSITKTP